MTEPTPAESVPKPTGPPVPRGEILSRSVPAAVADEDGRPTSSAFTRSSHDGLMSTFRQDLPAAEVAERWTGTSRLAGVWAVDMVHLETISRVAYADAGQPCACEGKMDDCEGPYPADHASVELRDLTKRSQLEKAAKAMKLRALEFGPLHVC